MRAQRTRQLARALVAIVAAAALVALSVGHADAQSDREESVARSGPAGKTLDANGIMTLKPDTDGPAFAPPPPPPACNGGDLDFNAATSGTVGTAAANSVTVTAAAGDDCQVSVTVNAPPNTLGQAANNVSCTWTGLPNPPSSPSVWGTTTITSMTSSIITIKAGESCTLSFTVTPSEAGQVLMSASTTGDFQKSDSGSFNATEAGGGTTTTDPSDGSLTASLECGPYTGTGWSDEFWVCEIVIVDETGVAGATAGYLEHDSSVAAFPMQSQTGEWGPGVLLFDMGMIMDSGACSDGTAFTISWNARKEIGTSGIFGYLNTNAAEQPVLVDFDVPCPVFDLNVTCTQLGSGTGPDVFDVVNCVASAENSVITSLTWSPQPTTSSGNIATYLHSCGGFTTATATDSFGTTDSATASLPC